MYPYHNVPNHQEETAQSGPSHPIQSITYTPLCTIEQWAVMCGLSVGTVQKHVERAIIPSIKLGKRRLVNVEAIRLKAAEHAMKFLL